MLVARLVSASSQEPGIMNWRLIHAIDPSLACGNTVIFIMYIRGMGRGFLFQAVFSRLFEFIPSRSAAVFRTAINLSRQTFCVARGNALKQTVLFVWCGSFGTHEWNGYWWMNAIREWSKWQLHPAFRSMDQIRCRLQLPWTFNRDCGVACVQVKWSPTHIFARTHTHAHIYGYTYTSNTQTHIESWCAQIIIEAKLDARRMFQCDLISWSHFDGLKQRWSQGVSEREKERRASGRASERVYRCIRFINIHSIFNLINIFMAVYGVL